MPKTIYVTPRFESAVANREVGHAGEVAPLRGLPIDARGAPAGGAVPGRLGIPDPVLVCVGEYPSPTVLVNGTDVMGGAAELSKWRVCPSDVPTRERVLAALRAALAAESPR
jgi:hypothetical protein